MSQISVTPLATGTVGGEVPAKTVRPQAQPVALDTGGGKPKDTVTLSPAAQATAGAVAGGAELSDTQATSAAVNLRQQLGSQTLSVTARQNQSILSLLRG